MRTPSPAVCAGCLRPHVRVDSSGRMARRAPVERSLGRLPEEVRAYGLALFDHLTLGIKVSDPAQPGQHHPAPAVPDSWTVKAAELVDRLVITAAHGL